MWVWKIQHSYKFTEKVAIYEDRIEKYRYRSILVNIVLYHFENPGIAHHYQTD